MNLTQDELKVLEAWRADVVWDLERAKLGAEYQRGRSAEARERAKAAARLDVAEHTFKLRVIDQILEGHEALKTTPWGTRANQPRTSKLPAGGADTSAGPVTP